MKNALSSLIIILATLLPCSLLAGVHTVHLGPAAIGGGGPNPISIPPLNPIDYEYVYLTDSSREWTIGLAPGLFYGVRAGDKRGLYASMGGGLAVSRNGGGFGVYTAIGINTFCGVDTCFNVEYKQAIGLSDGQTVNPYALRMGVALEW